MGLSKQTKVAMATPSSPSRQSVNLISFLVTCSILFVAVQVSDGSFATRFNSITESLDRAMFKIMDSGRPDFSDYHSNATYLSNNESFNPSGMAGLYNLTNSFMNFIVKEDIDVSSVIVVENHRIRLLDDKVPNFLASLAGVFTILILVLLFLVFLPLCGMFFCCCRCCGNCGARSQPCNKKQDLCKKVIYGSLLIIFTTMFLFCVVCTFVSNQQLHDGINDLPENANKDVADTKTFLDNTNNELQHLLKNNYNEFKDALVKTMDTSGQTVTDELTQLTNATAMTELSNIVNNLPGVNDSFKNLKDDTNRLRVYASQLNDALRKLKNDLMLILRNCQNLKECQDIYANITSLQTTIDFNKLPDVSSEIDYLQTSIDIGALQTAVKEGNKFLNNLQDNIKVYIKKGLNEANIQLDNAGDTISKSLDDVTDVVNKFKKIIEDHTTPAINDADKFIKEYGGYVYYGGVALSCILLLITLFITLGLICGICGKRPDGYSDNCCNKGIGSRFLICSVMIIFICGALIALVTISTFMVGLFSQRLACYPLRNPKESSILKIIDDVANIPSTGMNVTLVDMLVNCNNNESAYQVFNLVNKFNVTDAVANFNISKYLSDLDFSDVIDKNFHIISDDNLEMLEELAKFDPDVDFDKFHDELENNFTNYSLDMLSNELTNLVNVLSAKGDVYAPIVTSLQVELVHVNAYNEKLLEPMKNLSFSIINTTDYLRNNLSKVNGYDSFPHAILNLTNEIKDAQNMMTNGSRKEILNKIATDFTQNMESQIFGYTDRVVYYTTNRIGHCGPLSTVINSTLTSTCDKILTPLNGFWFSLFCSLLLFFPIIIVSVKLATLYQKYKSNGHYVETEYLYDAYTERDSIPLNSRGAKRGKKKNKKQKRYEDRPQNVPGAEVVTREYAGGSHPPDTRYADMAPKQWEEFPAGGPPQYQRAPTEYERPPPYYYPGTGEHQ